MNKKINDVASDYDDMVGYISEDNIPNNLKSFFGEELDDYKPAVKTKPKDPEFGEQWQDIYINFECIEDYRDFMAVMGEKPVPKLNEYVYTKDRDSMPSIFNFM